VKPYWLVEKARKVNCSVACCFVLGERRQPLVESERGEFGRRRSFCFGIHVGNVVWGLMRKLQVVVVSSSALDRSLQLFFLRSCRASKSQVSDAGGSSGPRTPHPNSANSCKLLQTPGSFTAKMNNLTSVKAPDFITCPLHRPCIECLIPLLLARRRAPADIIAFGSYFLAEIDVPLL